MTGARTARLGEHIQSLWSGYGEVRRVVVDDGSSVMVKHVRPPAEAHPRKLRSYRVEAAWYEGFAARCGDGCRVPRCYGTWFGGDECLFVLEDLTASGMKPRKMGLSGADTERCLSWLARFHGTFLHVPPEGLWQTGTYWHLATRPDELARMRNRRLREAAPGLDAQLREARFQTLVHGDAKAANFCLSDDEVAAVDFQYVGGGPGIRDVAYLLEGFGWLRGRRDRLLDHYFRELRRVRDEPALEGEWRALYPVAVQDFERFMDGWR